MKKDLDERKAKMRFKASWRLDKKLTSKRISK